MWAKTEFMGTNELPIKGCLRVIVPLRSKHLYLFFLFFLMSSALLCWYKLKYICSWQILLPVETQGQLRDLDFIFFLISLFIFFYQCWQSDCCIQEGKKETLMRRKHLSNKTSENTADVCVCLPLEILPSCIQSRTKQANGADFLKRIRKAWTSGT